MAAISEMLKASQAGNPPPPSKPPEEPPADNGSPAAGEEPGVPDADDLSQPAPETGQNTEQSQEAEPAADGDAGEVHPDPKAELPKWVKERISKTKSQRDAARQEAAELKAKLAELEAKAAQPEPETPQAPPPPPEAGPLAGITDPKALAAKHDEARNTVQLVEDLMDQLHDEPDKVEQQLREAGVKLAPGDGAWPVQQMREFLRSMRRNANQVLEAVPKRQQFLAGEERALNEVLKASPEMESKESPLRQAWTQVVNTPAFAKLRSTDPNWPVHAKRYALGVLAERQEQQKAQSAPVKTVNNPPKPPPRPIAETPRAQARATDAGDMQEAQIRAAGSRPGATPQERRALIALELRKTQGTGQG